MRKTVFTHESVLHILLKIMAQEFRTETENHTISELVLFHRDREFVRTTFPATEFPGMLQRPIFPRKLLVPLL